MFVATSIGVTELEPLFATYAVFPSGVIATPVGSWPTVIDGPGRFVARSIGVTLSGPTAPAFATYPVFPSGVIAIEVGPVPTLIGVPAVFVVRSIGVTEFDAEFTT